MGTPFMSEVKIISWNFAPKGWALCNGQFLPINQNQALFSLLGTTYGGDGKSNFALPNLEGNAPMHPGQGPGLSLHDLGETGGTQFVTLLESEMPSHSHTLNAHTPDNADLLTPTANSVLAKANPGFGYNPTNTGLKNMAFNSLTPVGGDQPHNNMQPYLTLNFCIALQGVFPPRT